MDQSATGCPRRQIYELRTGLDPERLRIIVLLLFVFILVFIFVIVVLIIFILFFVVLFLLIIIYIVFILFFVVLIFILIIVDGCFGGEEALWHSVFAHAGGIAGSRNVSADGEKVIDKVGVLCGHCHICSPGSRSCCLRLDACARKRIASERWKSVY